MSMHMKPFLVVMLVSLVLTSALPLSAAEDPPPVGPDEVDLFVSGKGGYEVYRIPAIVSTKQGALLAFCEGRKSTGDDSGDIDLLVRRSTDNGKTWSDYEIVWDDGINTCGNPCPVVEHKTGTICLLSTHNLGTDKEDAIISRESKGTRTVWLIRSRDDGVTWSTAENITASTKSAEWTWYATGPGAGIQLQHGPHKGRLVIPCDHIGKSAKHYFSHIIYSDDQGETWNTGGITPSGDVNECEVVELADGRLLLNMRNYDRLVPARQIAFSYDGGMTWKDQRHDETLIEPICQASIRRYRRPEGDDPGVILFSNPACKKRGQRENMTVRASTDSGTSWPYSRQLYAGHSAYSCLVELPNGKIGCFFEADQYERMVFATFSYDWLKAYHE